MTSIASVLVSVLAEFGCSFLVSVHIGGPSFDVGKKLKNPVSVDLYFVHDGVK